VQDGVATDESTTEPTNSSEHHQLRWTLQQRRDVERRFIVANEVEQLRR
jgi:hypothetical protein